MANLMKQVKMNEMLQNKVNNQPFSSPQGLNPNLFSPNATHLFTSENNNNNNPNLNLNHQNYYSNQSCINLNSVYNF